MQEEEFARMAHRLLIIMLICIIVLVGSVLTHVTISMHQTISAEPASRMLWSPPDTLSIPEGEEGTLIRYGRALINHTSVYLGPRGKIAAMSNGLNCTNCHLDGGTRPFAANYSAVASTYPKYRDRSGTIEDIEKRINDCFERSLNGLRLDTFSREMKAMVAYFKWLGRDVPRGIRPLGAGLVTLDYLDRAADPEAGEQHYLSNCGRCHGADGQGIMNVEGNEWIYPPLWGEQSYNTGAGLFRLSKFAAFIKMNMPFGVTHRDPLLTDEEAWDIAAFVNSMPRPHKDFPSDWPDLRRKPIDHPFGPYADTFSTDQHKYGPYLEISRQ